MTIQVVRQRTQESSLLLLLFSFLLPENQYTVLSVPPTSKCQFFTSLYLHHHPLLWTIIIFVIRSQPSEVFLLPHSPHAVFPTMLHQQRTRSFKYTSKFCLKHLASTLLPESREAKLIPTSAVLTMTSAGRPFPHICMSQIALLLSLCSLFMALNTV